ncbi:MAG: hypothetical protein KDC95_00915 [Planctomycetes bacterium]|nr:hypothetical protein [Planctomycetota bacterium]
MHGTSYAWPILFCFVTSVGTSQDAGDTHPTAREIARRIIVDSLQDPDPGTVYMTLRLVGSYRCPGLSSPLSAIILDASQTVSIRRSALSVLTRLPQDADSRRVCQSLLSEQTSTSLGLNALTASKDLGLDWQHVKQYVFEILEADTPDWSAIQFAMIAANQHDAKDLSACIARCVQRATKKHVSSYTDEGSALKCIRAVMPGVPLIQQDDAGCLYPLLTNKDPRVRLEAALRWTQLQQEEGAISHDTRRQVQLALGDTGLAASRASRSMLAASGWTASNWTDIERAVRAADLIFYGETHHAPGSPVRRHQKRVVDMMIHDREAKRMWCAFEPSVERQQAGVIEHAASRGLKPLSAEQNWNTGIALRLFGPRDTECAETIARCFAEEPASKILVLRGCAHVYPGCWLQKRVPAQRKTVTILSSCNGLGIPVDVAATAVHGDELVLRSKQFENCFYIAEESRLLGNPVFRRVREAIAAREPERRR